MSSKLTFSSASDYPSCPSGLWPARCIDIVDHGEEPTQYGPKHKLSLVFQVSAEGERFYLRKKMTFSAHKKSLMGATIKSWTGSLPAAGDQVENYYGLPALVNIQHTPKDDGDGYWVNIENVLPAGNSEVPPENLEGYRVPDGSEEKSGSSIIHDTSDIPF